MDRSLRGHYRITLLCINNHFNFLSKFPNLPKSSDSKASNRTRDVVADERPSGTRFCFNCYHHHALWLDHGAIGKSAIISSQEGVTQGDPLSMICYGIGILPLIRMLKREFPNAKQQWYADDGSTAGKFADLRGQF